LEALAQRLPAVSWLKVDIADSDSELAKQFKITQVPFLQVYDPQGQLIAEGPQAMIWIESQLR
jgi:hypothetical protein